jgi:signal peptidase
MGFEKDDFTHKKEITIILLSGVILYYIITYSTVFFWGILQNVVTLNTNTFINYVFPLFLIIVFSELIRYIMIRKGRKYKTIWILAVLVFTLMEITLKTRGYDFAQSLQLVRFSLEVVAVSLARNIFLCYLTNKAGYKPAILFRLLIELPLYMLPFFPNLDLLLDTIVKVVLPNILLFVLIYNYSKFEDKDIAVINKQTKLIARVGAAVLIIFLSIAVLLSSAKFSYFTLVVGSGSMSPAMEKGDIVVVSRNSDPSRIAVDDVLIFNKDNVTVIHRVIRIERAGTELLFITKGDANEDEDASPVREAEIIGTAAFRIKHMGYLTILLNESVN